MCIFVQFYPNFDKALRCTLATQQKVQQIQTENQQCHPCQTWLEIWRGGLGGRGAEGAEEADGAEKGEVAERADRTDVAAM